MKAKKRIYLISIMLAVIASCFVFIGRSMAQRSAGDVGIGFQAGQPTGLSIKIYKPYSLSPEFLVAWDLDDFFFLNITGLKEHHLGNSQQAHFFYGPGAFIGIKDRKREFEDEVILGLSLSAGISVVFDQLELFIQGTPRLALIDKTDFDMGGGIGLRYYF